MKTHEEYLFAKRDNVNHNFLDDNYLVFSDR